MRRTGGWRELFTSPGRRATILASVPWFLQDLGTYGIGIFTPTILVKVIGHEDIAAQNVSALIARDILAAKGAALLDVLLIVGHPGGGAAGRSGRPHPPADHRLHRLRGRAGARDPVSCMRRSPPARVLLFGGFMLFNFMTNVGPNAQTYLLAGEVFPTEVRGKGAGFAAAFAKVGAVLTAFLFPVLLADTGVDFLLIVLIATSLLGAWITWQFRIETTGVSLERDRAVAVAPLPPPPSNGGG